MKNKDICKDTVVFCMILKSLINYIKHYNYLPNLDTFETLSAVNVMKDPRI